MGKLATVPTDRCVGRARGRRGGDSGKVGSVAHLEPPSVFRARDSGSVLVGPEQRPGFPGRCRGGRRHHPRDGQGGESVWDRAQDRSQKCYGPQMDDPQNLAAAAALISAGIALLALILGIIGLIQSKSASKDAEAASREAQAARESSSDAQWKMTEHLGAIAVSMRDGASTSEKAAGQLTSRLVQRGRSHRLVVANVGTAPVRIEDISVGQDDVLIGDMVESLRGSELLPGEDHSILAAITFGTNMPLNVTLRWTDPDGQSHEREQTVNFS